MNNININKILQYVIMGLLAIIGVSIIVILLFLSKYSGDRIPIFYFYLFLLGLSIVGFGLYKILIFLDRPEMIDFKIRNRDEKNKNWERIRIKTKDIIVISSPYYQETPKSSNWRIQGLDSLSNDNGIKREKIECVYLKCILKNKTYKQLIGDTYEISLKMLLSKKENVDLYVNRNDKNHYYFDLQTTEQ